MDISDTRHILYRGAGISGRTTNVLYLHYYMSPEFRGRLISRPQHEDRQIFFRFRLPEMEGIGKNPLTFTLYCSPGAAYYPKSQYADVMKADAIVFVVDSQRERLEANKMVLNDMEHMLCERGQTITTFPWIIQYNKRDLSNTASIPELQHTLNRHSVPFCEAVATQGVGVFETLQTILHRVVPEIPENVVIPKTTEPDIQKYNETLSGR